MTRSEVRVPHRPPIKGVFYCRFRSIVVKRSPPKMSAKSTINTTLANAQSTLLGLFLWPLPDRLLITGDEIVLFAEAVVTAGVVALAPLSVVAA